MKKNILIIAAIFSIIALQFVFATTQEINYSISNPGVTKTSQFVIQTLKYDPFPVNAGGWFDLWIKAQNIGQDDAKNVIFQLQQDYPFEFDNSSVQQYNLIPGTISANKNQQANDGNIDANQVLMKFRVKVADNAPEGNSVLKIKFYTDNSGSEGTFNLPIEIAKTKSNFDVTMQDFTPQGISLIIANDNINDAGTVLISAEKQNGLSFLNDYTLVSIGDLKEGDFVVAHLKVIPNSSISSINVKIDYTDISGIRTSVERIVPVVSTQTLEQISAGNSKNNSSYLFGSIGFILGILIILLIQIIRKRK